AMNQLDQMTQQNSSTSEECASAAEELSSQAEALKNAVALLTQTVNGSGGGDLSMSAPEATQLSAPKAERTSSESKVIPLKKTTPPRTSAEDRGPVVLKRASGDTPHYDHRGFE